MHDARDAEDQRLLEAGEHKLLLAGYFTPVRDRCFFRLGTRDAGDEAAQHVFVRLLGELRKGKTYPVPFRVVVWMVTEWTLRGFHVGRREVEFPEEWDPAGPDAFAEWEQDHDLAALFADLPQRQRQVLDLRYRLGLTPAEIAEQLGIEANAVYQALHNGHAKLREKLRV
jgi:RNA polymerase sigma-70 factor (ECF subfamily)